MAATGRGAHNELPCSRYTAVQLACGHVLVYVCVCVFWGSHCMVRVVSHCSDADALLSLQEMLFVALGVVCC